MFDEVKIVLIATFVAWAAVLVVVWLTMIERGL